MIIDQIFNSNKKKTEESFETVKNSETATRSIVKSISWRLVGTIDTFIISWVITGEVALALSIGSIELITKMVLYFFHERFWNTIKWGKQ